MKNIFSTGNKQTGNGNQHMIGTTFGAFSLFLKPRIWAKLDSFCYRREMGQ